MLREIRRSLPIDSWNVNKADINWIERRQRGTDGRRRHRRRRRKPAVPDRRTVAQGDRGDVLRLSRLHRRSRPDSRRAATTAAPITAPSISSTAAPGTTVNNLLAILGVTKQSLNRVLRTLIEDGLVESRVGQQDKRERHLFLTRRGAALERELSDAQRARMRAAYREAGPEAVQGFRTGARGDDGPRHAPPLSRP